MKRSRQQTWTLVLAAGDGTRLASMTTDARGNAVPKQFCSLAGGSTLMQDAMARARRIALRERRCAIVAAQHEQYWSRPLWSMPRGNVVVQPRNRGTANGVLLAVLRILELDPLARIVFLPSDHFVRDEDALGGSLQQAVELLHRGVNELVLIGIEPDEADPELGYIVPRERDAGGSRRVARFVEKPPTAVAHELIGTGALWNSFIFAADGPALLGLLREQMPSVVEDMATALALDARRGVGPIALSSLYDELPIVDFSKAIMANAADRLTVVTAPACGWSDLGTPMRVAQALRRIEPRAARTRSGPAVEFGFINLAAQHARLSLAR